MEAEGGNTREVGVREVQFHLQGRLEERDIAGADWAGFFAAAARKLEALRGGRKAAKVTRARKAPAKRRAKGRRPARKAAPRRGTARRRR
jgi:hypothetical protein